MRGRRIDGCLFRFLQHLKPLSLSRRNPAETSSSIRISGSEENSRAASVLH